MHSHVDVIGHLLCMQNKLQEQKPKVWNKDNKNFYWMSSRISIGRPLESTGRPVEML